MNRNLALKKLTAETLDVLVVGGGIVGSGILRDAAMRGLKTGLVEQHDFAFGTSSRSSRLLHGGLRYLAQGRVGLVREASLEKRVLHRIAPHLAEPLPFIFPTYSDNRHWILWQLKIGVKIYDLLCSGRNLGASTWLNRGQLLNRVPGLRQDGLRGAVRYYDGLTSDARLTLDTLRSGARAGGIVINYCRFESAQRDPEGLWACVVRNQLTDREYQVRARAVVNATGPWAQQVPHSSVKLRLTKGIHLVIDRSRLPLNETVVMTEGKRILFAIPWGQRMIVGTTDTDYFGPPENVASESEDIRYVLSVANRTFPQASLRESDVISCWAGLRPLVADPNGKPSDISRSHEIHNPEPGWWDVAGGKLTTYRLMAEQTIDSLISKLGPLGRPIAPCRTAEEPLLPPEATAGISGILPPDFNRRIVEHMIDHEWALHLDDVMLRRTSWHYYNRDAADQAALVADWMGEKLGWNSEQREAQLERYLALSGKTAPRETVPAR